MKNQNGFNKKKKIEKKDKTAMEEESCWSSATNWTVAHGSLQNSISFESPMSPIEEGSDAILKDHLLLKPPAPDSGPCEISVSFRQSHEICRVYVQSTARVYEIYYAPKQQSDNEYLCTVRCGATEKEDGILHACDSGEAAFTVSQEGSREITKSPKSLVNTNNNSHGSDEDSWVEVKLPDSSLQDDTANSLSKKIDRNTGRNIQVFYEATAEITDASPCISLTLRLLSLQTKEHVHIEEIYIFAVPVESTDSDNHINPMDNLTGSSILTMLVPTLLQLSRTGNNRIHDRHASETRGQKYQDGGSKPTELTSPEKGRSKMQQEMQSSLTDPIEEKSPERSQVLPESVTIEKNMSYSRVEIVLDELVCRVGRIETFCSRFEETMLNPLTCMATKLQRLEQKLDALTAVFEPSKSNVNTCSRFAAPEFSNDESESNSLYNEENKGYEASESTRKDDISFDRISSPCFDDASDSDISPTELFPSLVVTAPEFSNGDDKDDKNCNDVSESVEKSCPVDKPALSIDDALASALAGFLSSSVQPHERSPSLILKAPDFSNEEDDSNDELASPSGHIPCEGAENPSTNVLEYNETDSIKDSDLISCISSRGSDVQVQQHAKRPIDSYTEATVEEIIPCKQLHMEVIDKEETTNVVIFMNHFHKNWTEDGSMNSSYNETVPENPLLTEWANESNTDTVDIAFTRNQLYTDQNPNRGAEAIACIDPTTSTVINVGYEEDGSVNKLEQSFVSSMDFELPILDVKFVSQANEKTCLPLEALLSDIPDTKIEVIDVAPEPKDPTVKDQFLIELEDLIVKDVPFRLEGEELQDPYVTSTNQEPFSSLI